MHYGNPLSPRGGDMTKTKQITTQQLIHITGYIVFGILTSDAVWKLLVKTEWNASKYTYLLKVKVKMFYSKGPISQIHLIQRLKPCMIYCLFNTRNTNKCLEILEFITHKKGWIELTLSSFKDLCPTRYSVAQIGPICNNISWPPELKMI